jgi:glycolate oxidase
LEDVVGARNISEDPVILDGYAFQMKLGLEDPPYSRFMLRPAAVVLPENTEEVQAIVKICNRQGIKFKAHSTGWGPWNAATVPDMILLDLRRMNRIIEVDEENMLAVVEPYVVGGQLLPEVLKKGLYCNLIGAGANTSILASCTSFGGAGFTGLATGYNGRNVLGIEWVLPDGTLIKLGALGAGAGWFCGEGPGPGIRGLARGLIGATGGFGIYTKCAVKLYPWPEDVFVPAEGITPTYTWPLPKRFRNYTLSFPNWERFGEALYRISEAEIGFSLCTALRATFGGSDVHVPFFTVKRLDPNKTVDDIPGMMEDPKMQALIEEMRKSLQIIIAAKSEGDLAYQEKVLRKILEETDGHIVKALDTEEVQQIMHMNMLKAESQTMCFDQAGGLLSGLGTFTVQDVLMKETAAGEEYKKDFIKDGGILNDGGDAMFIDVYEHGIAGHVEELAYYDPHDHESCKAGKEYTYGITKVNVDLGYGAGALGISTMVAAPEEDRKPFLSVMGPYFSFQGRIRRAFDPNNVSDPFTYYTDIPM